MKKINILIIGSLPPPVGGTTVLLLYLINEIKKNNDVSINIINTSRYKGNLNFLIEFYQNVKLINGSDIVTLHISSASFYTVGIIVLFLCRLMGRPLIIRKFGGTKINELPYYKRKLSEVVLRYTNLYLAETKELVLVAEKQNIKPVYWYPNSRPLPNILIQKTNERVQHSRFVFMGAIWSKKGVYQIIDSGRRFKDGEVVIDLYGNTGYDIRNEELQNLKNVYYKGPYEPSNVYDILQRYDVLLLPTFHDGEGYPGVIIEAFMVGLPIICTRWKAIPELVDETCGILIESKSVDSLYEAMVNIMKDNNNYQKMSKNALERGKQFSSGFWALQFINYCRLILKNKKNTL